jgi:hypothetical protein
MQHGAYTAKQHHGWWTLQHDVYAIGSYHRASCNDSQAGQSAARTSARCKAPTVALTGLDGSMVDYPPEGAAIIFSQHRRKP